MPALCIVALGIVQASIATETLSLEWEHSVQKTRWEERYRVTPDELVLVAARVAGSGAGMEAPPDARFDGSMWSWQPNVHLPELILAASAYTSDYRICTAAGCAALAALAHGASPVTLRPCSTQ